MSGPWTITFADFYRASGGRLTTKFACFDVEQAGGPSFRFVAGLTDTVAHGLQLKGAALERLIADAGLEELEAGLAAGVYPPQTDDGRPVECVFSTEHWERLQVVLEREKQCLWQDRSPRGWLCKATREGDDDRTTVALCSGCTIPDERIICAHLVHPSVSMLGTMGESKRVASPMCNVGNDPRTGEKCRPAGLECWRRLHVSRPSPVDPPPDISRRATDEIDYLTLVYRDRYDGAHLWTVPQARTVSELFGDCETAEDFQRRVAALADLLSRLSPHDQLDEQDQTGEDGKRVGPLVALERLMTRDHPEAIDAVRTLRAIASARNAFPIHTRSERLRDTLAALGVDFPPNDWRLAWLRVLTAFWSSLQAIRVAIQTGVPAEER